MRYYLDFDRVIFDTNAFLAYTQERVGEPEHGMNAHLAELASNGTLAFEPGELSPFLFKDAASFLREKENAVTIVTSGNRTLQELKTKSALHGIPRMAVMYTGDVRKGQYLAPHTHLHKDAVFADDSPIELETLAGTCPELGLYEVRRDGIPGDGRWPVISLLSQLP